MLGVKTARAKTRTYEDAREGDKMNVVPKEKYGLSPAHAIHLEGITYPPERRASMSMSLGALTTVLCMLRTKGKYRGKWEDSVTHPSH